jgi:hypothetical protein
VTQTRDFTTSSLFALTRADPIRKHDNKSSAIERRSSAEVRELSVSIAGKCPDAPNDREDWGQPFTGQLAHLNLAPRRLNDQSDARHAGFADVGLYGGGVQDATQFVGLRSLEVERLRGAEPR